MRFNPQLKLLYNLKRIDKLLRGENPPPTLVEISPTNKCNAKCPWCFYHDREDSNETLDTIILQSAITNISKLGGRAINWTGGGEPTLHKDLSSIIDYANKQWLKQGMFTNGLDPERITDNFEHLSWARISLTDKYMAPGVKESIKKYHSLGVTVGVSMNITKDTPKDLIEKMCELSRKYKADYFQVRPALETPPKKQKRIKKPKGLILYNTPKFKVELSDYKFDSYLKPRGYEICYGHNLVPAIHANGNVGACMYQLDNPNYIFGNLYEETFLKIWRKKSLEIKVNGDCQVCCKNHEINQLLYELKHPSLEDKEFI